MRTSRRIKKEYEAAFREMPSIHKPMERLKKFEEGSLSLFSLFTWRNTPEGYDFWSQMFYEDSPGARLKVLKIICEKQEDCTWV